MEAIQTSSAGKKESQKPLNGSDTEDSLQVKEPETTSLTACPECRGELTTVDSETHCRECGLIVAASRFNDEPDWGAVSSNDDTENERGAGPSTFRTNPDTSLETNIGYLNESEFSDLSSGQQERLSRARRYNYTSNSEYTYGYCEIDRMVTALGYKSQYQTQAKKLFKQARDEHVAHGFTIESTATACVYAIFRIHSAPITLSEVGDVSRDTQTRVTQTLKKLKQRLSVAVPPAAPEQFVRRITSDLGLSQPVTNQAKKLVKRTEDKKETGGTTPEAIAAGAVLQASTEIDSNITDAYNRCTTAGTITRRDVAECVNISIRTVSRAKNCLVELGTN